MGYSNSASTTKAVRDRGLRCVKDRFQLIQASSSNDDRKLMVDHRRSAAVIKGCGYLMRQGGKQSSGAGREMLCI